MTVKKKLLAKVAKLAALTFAAAIIVTGTDAMTVHAMDWGNTGNLDGTDFGIDDIRAEIEDEDEVLTEEKLKEIEEQTKAIMESLMSDKYFDVNTLNATVKIK